MVDAQILKYTRLVPVLTSNAANDLIKYFVKFGIIKSSFPLLGWILFILLLLKIFDIVNIRGNQRIQINLIFIKMPEIMQNIISYQLCYLFIFLNYLQLAKKCK